MKFEFLEHTSEMKFRAYGSTLDEAFESVVLAFADFVGKGEKIKPVVGKVINVSGKDKKSLLYNFLEELIYLIDAENFVVSKAEVFVRGNNLKAELFGDDSAKYNLDYVKAATYAEMEIKEGDGGWVLQMVVDV